MRASACTPAGRGPSEATALHRRGGRACTHSREARCARIPGPRNAEHRHCAAHGGGFGLRAVFGCGGHRRDGGGPSRPRPPEPSRPPPADPSRPPRRGGESSRRSSLRGTRVSHASRKTNFEAGSEARGFSPKRRGADGLDPRSLPAGRGAIATPAA